MARRPIPLIEVTAPDGIKSFWVAYSIPHKEAVAAVKDRIPPDHTAELSVRRLPPRWNFKGARPGDVIKLDFDANSTRAANRGRFLGQTVEDPDEMAARLLATVRNMPPGHKRLREIERVRSRLHSLLRSRPNSRQ
jgi:hypothetical protein